METSLDSTSVARSQSSKRAADPFGFAQKRLPWIVAGAFLAVYVVTLSRWVSYQGLPTLARSAGWDWHLVYTQPLHFLVLFPVRWLPAEWQVVGLNLFSALCSVLTLALLARSVAILPHDRTRDQRQLERNDFAFLSIPGAWLPPLFAVMVCGLQLTFWEHSILASGESLDLLIFAYCIRCLLEHRLDQRNSWLYRMAFLIGISMTSNYAMIAALPGFIAATIWIKKRSFFKLRFLTNMTLLGLAGLLLYLVLPAINTASPLNHQTFLEIVRVNLGFQRSAITGFPRYLILLVGLTSLFPILFIGIKWPDQLGDTSALGNVASILTMHLIHAVFFIACLYVAFDPPFSPRKLGMGQSMLPYYYLGALSIGYFAGYFMLVFGHMELRAWHRHRALRTVLNKAIVALVWVAALGVPAGLVIKNLPEVRKTSGPYLATMASQVADALPQQGCVVLSDDPYRLYMAYEALNRRGTLSNYVLVDTSSLSFPAYQRHLRKKYGERWPAILNDVPLERSIHAGSLIDLMLRISGTTQTYYLQPSFGYYFEYFFLTPRGMVYEMKPYPAGELTGPKLSADTLKENDAFWSTFIARNLKPLRQPKTELKRGKKDPGDRNMVTYAAASMYSRALTWLGVEAQKGGYLEEARKYFNAALELNPDNASAFISLDYNTLLREGKRESPKFSEGAFQRLGLYGNRWETVVAVNGPIDDPGACYGLAGMFARGKNFRQAAQHLARIVELNPENVEVRIWLAGMYIQARFFAGKALELVQQIRSEPKKTPLTQQNQMALTQTEAWAHVYRGDVATAEKILQEAQQKNPQDDTPFSTLTEIYFRIEQEDKAVALLEKELSRDPGSVAALVNYAAIKIKRKEYQTAVELLDRALKNKQNSENAYVLINRAIANLNLGRLDEARRDYETIARNTPSPPYSVHFGLAEIAWRKKDRKNALKYYNNYLKVAPGNTAEYEQVQQRIKALKSGAPIGA
ncbi:MAG: tetratricopeptide repeat protein [Verrucomicrobia subdivision 3 bacterium]|nr:tetratricopeptide repeat protein [Limisphaerales bacterium]